MSSPFVRDVVAVPGAPTLPALAGPWPPRSRWPEPLHRAVESVRAVRAEHPGPVLVALSGGADSLALAVACAVLAGTRAGERLGPAGAVVVDHGLQDGSAAVAVAAARTARALGLAPVTVEAVTVTPAGDGPEASARSARRTALARAAEGVGEGTPALVLTAHTADDQAEQVLLGLARGSGTRSLAGIPAHGALPGGVALARPLLGLSRADTEAICRWAGLTWFTDPHNADPALLRSRVRTRILPALEDPDTGLGPGLRAALVRTAAIAAEDAAALDAWADDALARLRLPAPETDRPAPVLLDLDALAALPAAVRHRVHARAARAAGAGTPSRERILAADALVAAAHAGGGSAGPVELGHGVTVRRVAAGEGGVGGRKEGGPSGCARLAYIPRPADR